MSKSVNKVILIANLGKDPEVRNTASGTPVARLSLATTQRHKDNAGEWHDRTEWHSVVAWKRLAEIASQYLKKGTKVYIEGRLQTSSWEDKQTGEKKSRTDIIVEDLIMLNGRGDAQEGRESKGNGSIQTHPEEGAVPEIGDEEIPF